MTSSAPAMVPPEEAVDHPFWWAFRSEQRLAGIFRPPPGFPFAQIGEHLGLTAVVALVGEVEYDCSPLPMHQFMLEDLHGRDAPADPERERDAVRQAAETTRRLLGEGHGVLVHCEGGTGRTGTVIGAVLVSYGHRPEEVNAWLAAVHRRRGQPGWPECPWQQEALSVART